MHGQSGAGRALRLLLGKQGSSHHAQQGIPGQESALSGRVHAGRGSAADGSLCGRRNADHQDDEGPLRQRQNQFDRGHLEWNHQLHSLHDGEGRGLRQCPPEGLRAAPGRAEQGQMGAGKRSGFEWLGHLLEDLAAGAAGVGLPSHLHQRRDREPWPSCLLSSGVPICAMRKRS